MSKHTPGPWTAWKLNRGGSKMPVGVPITASGLAIARAFESSLLNHAKANARLIAASPELYELALAIRAYESIPLNEFKHRNRARLAIFEDARRIVAKVEGK